METAKLKRFAQYARRSLIEQVSAKLKLVLAEDSAAQRENVQAIKKLESAIHDDGKDQVIERVAYIWFNRFCALRFMDMNRYNRVGIVSPADPGQFQPEILAEAKMGHIDEEMVHDKIRQQVFALLDGKAPSRDPQGEAYRLLVVAACNSWNKAMPFLFQRIEDYTELLMPDDLLSGKSILAYTREAMTPDVCEDVEVIGWLYQFYISEKKDQVFDGLKKNKKITPENIPAATQLFTPHWIVRYLVENSLGRLWLLNRPSSKLAEQMDYYIKPEQAETDFLRIGTPEEIKICDPACGSGHMLTYAFDLLYAIYEEEGNEPAEIPEKILNHNLYGIEIDERAGELAAFALTMKARAKQRRFFNKGVKPNICVLENVHFDEDELKEYMNFVGRDLFTLGLENTLRQFEEADNFGSLIRPDVTDVDSMLEILESKNVSGHLFLSLTHQKVLQALRQSDYLSPKYHVVIANPPYMGGKGMNGRLGAWAKDNYPNSKSDLFAMFIDRGFDLVPKLGYSAMVTMESWMFLSSYERLRLDILGKSTIDSMVHMPYLGKGGTSMGISFGTTATIFHKLVKPLYKGTFSCIRYYETDDQGVPFTFPTKNERSNSVSSLEFIKVPGSPVTYWVKQSVYNAFKSKNIGNYLEVRAGLTTGNTDRFLKLWHEIAFTDITYTERSLSNQSSYIPYDKGGEFRKWYGNLDYVLRYCAGSMKEMQKGKGFRPDGISHFFRPSITWSKVTSSFFGARYSSEQNGFDATASSAFGTQENIHRALIILNSKLGNYLLDVLNSTMVYLPRDIKNFPIVESIWESNLGYEKRFNVLVGITKVDWDSCETSWGFTSLPMLQTDYIQPTLKATYQKLRAQWSEMTLEMQRLEKENNRIFIDAYGLQDELTPEVLLNEITLTCNPHYRYGNYKSEDEQEALLLADTMRELVSYAVGCMFGRYALDKPGLILANQGETIDDYLKHIPEPSFPADDDNVIPMLDGDWFTDDIAERFRKFLRVTFGDEHYEENLKFVEKALGKDIRKYFAKVDVKKADNFYGHHVTRYKKRPIYWLFSSPNGNFNALIYMHRYRPDTVSVVLNDYLREFRTKLASEKNREEAKSISASATQGEKTKALKNIEKINKMIVELEEYEREELYPLATQQIEIDLDDGVKVNYSKFGVALKKIPGLDVKEDD
jgi:type II restriction/modification system DNA methylase subunit YeeA